MPTILPRDRDHAAELARRLIDAAGLDRRDEVRTVSEGRIGLAFDVPDDVAAAVLGVPVGEALPPEPVATPDGRRAGNESGDPAGPVVADPAAVPSAGADTASATSSSPADDATASEVPGGEPDGRKADASAPPPQAGPDTAGGSRQPGQRRSRR
jgi:hypothetical protein